MTRRASTLCASVACCGLALIVPGLPAAGSAAPAAADGSELTVGTRLADRRALVTGDRAYAMGTEDGRWPAAGWHITGEMGGVWAPPLKLLDGMGFAIDGAWAGPATGFTSGQGYTRYALPTGTAGLALERTDVVPDGMRAALIGLTFRATAGAKRFALRVDAHSELLSAYPWAGTTPDARTANLPDASEFD